MSPFEIRESNREDRRWTERLLKEFWNSTKMVSRGIIHDASLLPGFIALQGDERLGLVTYHLTNSECEIVTLNSLSEGIGIGTQLIRAVKDLAVSSGCKRLWLITTNDNTAALHFYQKRGFLLVAVHRNSLERSRELKPEIPGIGIDGIPLRDEIELEMPLPDCSVNS